MAVLRRGRFRSARQRVVGGAVALAFALLSFAPGHAETLVFHASASGRQTLDQGEGGGNPFASALIEVLARQTVSLAELPPALRELTRMKSGGFQAADVPDIRSSRDWTLVPPSPAERRLALVLVVSDYARSGGVQSLPGARNDAARIAAALTAAGFATEVAVDFALPAMKQKLASFALASAASDAAVIYTTGHGVEVGGAVYRLPGDYPVEQRNAALAEHAIGLSDIAGALRAKRINLVFYGGCRDDPFGP
jgi:hypothetical protein